MVIGIEMVPATINRSYWEPFPLLVPFAFGSPCILAVPADQGDKKSLKSIPVDDLEWMEWFEIDQKTRKIYCGEEMNRMLVLYWVGGVTSTSSHNDCPAVLSIYIDISKNEKTKNQRYMYLGCSINGGRKSGQHKMSTIVVATATDRKFI